MARMPKLNDLGTMPKFIITIQINQMAQIFCFFFFFCYFCCFLDLSLILFAPSLFNSFPLPVLGDVEEKSSSPHFHFSDATTKHSIVIFAKLFINQELNEIKIKNFPVTTLHFPLFLFFSCL